MDETVKMTQVEVVSRFVIRVTFTDGAVRKVDLSSLAQGRPRWGEQGFFARLQLDRESDTVLWPDGDHLHGEALYDWHADASKAL